MRILQRVVRVTVAAVLCAVCGPSTASAQDLQRQMVVVESRAERYRRAPRLRSTRGPCCVWGDRRPGCRSPSRLPAGFSWLEVAAPNFQVRQVSVKLSALDAPPVEVVSVWPVSRAGDGHDQAWHGGGCRTDAPVVTVHEADDSAGGRSRRRRRSPGRRRGDGPTEHVRSGVAVPAGPDRVSRAQPNRRRPVQQLDVPFRPEPVPRRSSSEPGAAIEAMLGPASSQFGSDALGGAIQVVTPPPCRQRRGDQRQRRRQPLRRERRRIGRSRRQPLPGRPGHHLECRRIVAA